MERKEVKAEKFSVWGQRQPRHLSGPEAQGTYNVCLGEWIQTGVQLGFINAPLLLVGSQLRARGLLQDTYTARHRPSMLVIY